MMKRIWDSTGKIDLGRLESLVKELCADKYRYDINASNSTNSIYVTISNEYCGRTIRISDHAKYSRIRQVNLDQDKNTEYIIGRIRRMIRRLDHMSIDAIFQKIQK